MRPLRTYGIGMAFVGVGLVYYVHQRSAESGLGYGEILRRLPAETRHLFDDTLRRSVSALEDGLVAARSREIEIVRDLEAFATRRASG